MLARDIVDADRFMIVARLNPFRDEIARGAAPVGMSISDALDLLPHGTPGGMELHVLVSGEHIDPAFWPNVRPKRGTIMTVTATPAGGNALPIISSVLKVAAIVASFFGPYGWIASAIFTIAAVAIDIAYYTTLEYPSPNIPSLISDPAPQSQTLAVGATRNAPDPYGPEPRILGTHRAVPKLAAAQVSETVGDERWLRAVFALSFGPVAMTDMKIGETDLSRFSDVRTEIRRGYLDWMITDKGGWPASSDSYPESAVFGDRYTVIEGGTVAGITYAIDDTITFNGLAPTGSADAWDLNQDKPLRLYPKDIFQEGFNISLTEEGGWQVRTTQVDCDEIAVDITCPRGLLIFTPTGEKLPTTVVFNIRYAPAGTEMWTNVKDLHVSGKTTSPVFGGKTWTVDRTKAVNGQFDVGIRRVTPDENPSGDETLRLSDWTGLRTYTNEPPVQRPGMALFAVRIPPSDLARGVLDTFSCVLSSIVRKWNAATQAWEWGTSSNPAALVRAVYQICDEYRRLPDSRLDLDRLAEWSEYCDAEGLESNAYIDWAATVSEAATTLMGVGRAVPWPADGTKLSVVIDNPKAAPVQHFTPRNTWDYEGEIVWPEYPDAVRVAFPNEEVNWRIDERVVYSAGQTEDTAVNVQRAEMNYITSPAQVHKQARYQEAKLKYRRETHTWNADMEALNCQPLDWVMLTHDVIAVGMASGRIAGVTAAGGEITALQLDEPVTMVDTENYAVRVRSADHGNLTLTLATAAGTATTVTLAVPVDEAAGPAAGDLYAFGIAGRETVDLLVRSIKPGWDNTAKLTGVPLAPEVHTAADEPLPDFVSSVTQPLTIPAPVVLSVRSGSDVMLVGPGGVLQPRVLFTLSPPDIPDVTLHVFHRPTGTTQGFAEAAVDTRGKESLSVIGLETGGTYDFLFQYTHPDRLFASEATRINGHTIVGRDDVPDALQNFELSIAGGQALARWSLVPDLDVQFGGWIEFRWSPETSGASWTGSTLIGDYVPGSATHAWLPLKAGTYLARVFDSGARYSDVATAVTKQASVLTYVNVDTIQEDVAFSGVKTGLEVTGGVLTLDLSGGFDDIGDVDAVADVDTIGITVVASGVYTFAAGYDHASVARFRLTSLVRALVVSVYDDIDSRAGLVDDWDDIDAVDGAPANAAVYVRATDDDPAGTPTWTSWTRLDASEMEARAFEFEARLTTTSFGYNIEVDQLRVAIDAVA